MTSVSDSYAEFAQHLRDLSERPIGDTDKFITDIHVALQTAANIIDNYSRIVLPAPYQRDPRPEPAIGLELETAPCDTVAQAITDIWHLINTAVTEWEHCRIWVTTSNLTGYSYLNYIGHADLDVPASHVIPEYRQETP